MIRAADSGCTKKSAVIFRAAPGDSGVGEIFGAFAAEEAKSRLLRGGAASWAMSAFSLRGK